MKKVVIGFIVAAMTTPVVADSGFYAELALGNADNKTSIKGYENGDLIETFSFSKSTNSYGIKGGYQFGQNFAIELGLQENGDATHTEVDEFVTYSDKIETSSTNIGVKGILPLGDIFSLNARLGLAFWDFSSNSTDSEFPEDNSTFSKSGNDIYYSIGGEFIINQRFNIGFEYSTITMNWGQTFEFFDDVYRSDIDHKVDNISVTLKFKF